MKLTRPKYIVFNGPLKSGKSTLAEEAYCHLTRLGYDALTEGFAWPMKRFLAHLLGTYYDRIDKDAVNELLWETPRQFLIDLSEVYIKPFYSHDFFGRALIHRTSESKVYIIDDCGFSEEFSALPRIDTHLIRVYRPGHDFVSDSRGYLPDCDYLIPNDGELSKAKSVTRDIINAIIEKWKCDPTLTAPPAPTLTQSRDNQDVQASDNLLPRP